MPELELLPASTLGLEELAALFTAGYEDYYVPIVVDAGAISFMANAFDYDLEGSRVAVQRRRAGRRLHARSPRRRGLDRRARRRRVRPPRQGSERR